jgi:hypothetical protein
MQASRFGELRAPGRTAEARRGATVVVLLLVMCLTAFAVRIRNPVSRSPQWLVRSLAFNEAIDTHDWAATYQQYHPGYTTMLISGTSIRVYHKAINTDSPVFAPLRAVYNWAIPPYTTRIGRDMIAGVVGLAGVNVALLALIVLALARLGGWRLGFAAGGLLAFSPFFLADSRMLHVDALLSSLMLLSALLILLYKEMGHRRYLLLSGLAAGCALLTKTPALYLVPYTGLVLGVSLILRLADEWAERRREGITWVLGPLWADLVGPLLLWMVVAVLPFALWPAMWVQPIAVLRDMALNLSFHAGSPHPHQRFFLGRIYTVSEPPNRLFYLVVLLFRTSFVTSTLGIVAVGIAVLGDRRRVLPLRRRTFWLLVAYVFFFILQMTLGTKQDQRYILPAFLAVIVLAGVGLASTAALIDRKRPDRPGGNALVVGAIALQMIAGLPYAPDYGAQFNHLLGGNRGGSRVLEVGDQTEGITYVARYLQAHAGSDETVAVMARGNPSVAQYHEEVVAMEPGADYYFFDLNHHQRMLESDTWMPLWERFDGQQPEIIVQFDGVTYLRLFKANDADNAPPVIIRRGGLWLTALAWAWVAGLSSLLWWALRLPDAAASDVVSIPF